MARSFDGSTQSLTGAYAPATAAPLSMACRFKTTSLGTAQTLVSLGANAASGDQFRLLFRGDLANDPIEFTARASGSNSTATINTSASSGVWYHAAGVTASTTSRYAYFNGTASSQSASSRTPTSIARTGLGAAYLNTIVPSLAGELAEVGIWSTDLSADEISQLAAGYSPLMVRPQSLVFYAPLHGRNGAAGNEEDWIGGLTLTQTSSPGLADHPRIIYPRRRTAIWVPPAVGGTPTLSDLKAVNITATTVQGTYDYAF